MLSVEQKLSVLSVNGAIKTKIVKFPYSSYQTDQELLSGHILLLINEIGELLGGKMSEYEFTKEPYDEIIIIQSASTKKLIATATVEHIKC